VSFEVTATKFEAIAKAERAIDRALAPTKLRVVRPENWSK